MILVTKLPDLWPTKSVNMSSHRSQISDYGRNWFNYRIKKKTKIWSVSLKKNWKIAIEPKCVYNETDHNGFKNERIASDRQKSLKSPFIELWSQLIQKLPNSIQIIYNSTFIEPKISAMRRLLATDWQTDRFVYLQKSIICRSSHRTRDYGPNWFKISATDKNYQTWVSPQ